MNCRSFSSIMGRVHGAGPAEIDDVRVNIRFGRIAGNGIASRGSNVTADRRLQPAHQSNGSNAAAMQAIRKSTPAIATRMRGTRRMMIPKWHGTMCLRVLAGLIIHQTTRLANCIEAGREIAGSERYARPSGHSMTLVIALEIAGRLE